MESTYSLAFQDHIRDRLLRRMRQRKVDALAAEAVGVLKGLAAEAQGGALAGQADDLNVLPGDAVAQAGADGLETGLFGGKAGGQAFGRVGPGQAVAQLSRGEDPVKKTVSKALH